MTNEAVLQADYRIISGVPSRSCYILKLEIPWEHYDKANEVLGAPPAPGENRWVAIVRLKDHFPDLTKMVPDHIGDADEMVKPSKPKGEHGNYARKLYTSGFFLHQEVLEALGTDEEFRKWIQMQKSCVSGQQDYIGMDTGEMRCEASHVERVHAGHGKAIKAPYCCVPLTHEEHQLRHQKGETGCLNKYKKDGYGEWNERNASEWLWKQRCEHVTKWAHEQAKIVIAAWAHEYEWKSDSNPYGSLANTSFAVWKAWAEEHNLTQFLPKSER